MSRSAERSRRSLKVPSSTLRLRPEGRKIEGQPGYLKASKLEFDKDILRLVVGKLFDRGDPVAELFQRAEGARADIDQDRGIALRETASNLGRDLSTVSLAVKRLAEKMREDRKLQKQVSRLRICAACCEREEKENIKLSKPDTDALC